MADIVVYGGSFAGVAAAAKAASKAPNKTVALIVPDTSGMLGGIGTAGGQNFFDIRRYNNNTTYAQQGSFSWWRNSLGQFYSTVSMSNLMKSDLAKYSSRLTIYYGYDIKSVAHVTSPYRITSVTIRKIKRSTASTTAHYVVWGTQSLTISGSVFIDASEDGRLTRLANFGGTVGRYDWPASRLEAFETGLSGKARQQAATLMFKVRGVSTQYSADVTYVNDPNTSVIGGYGGKNTYKNNQTIKDFNLAHGPDGFAIKPFNIAQDGPNSNEFWINILLLFNVDGRACYRDLGTSNYPTDTITGHKNVDQAWSEARSMINTSEFLNAIKCMPSLQNVEIVKEYDPVTHTYLPVVGEMIYLRETIHSAGSLTNNNGTENTNYGLTSNECHKAGAPSTVPSGGDSSNYSYRIGLNYYRTDINAYTFEDLKLYNDPEHPETSTFEFIWGEQVAKKLRSDMDTSAYPINSDSPSNPVYVPFNAITTAYVANLLVPGYAACVSSFAWSEVRVIPNLCVLGDAAGIAAAYAVNNGKNPLSFTQTDISNVQTMLTSVNAKLNK